VANARHGRFVRLPQEAAQALAFRTAIFREGGVIDVDLQFVGEESREGGFRKLQHVTAAHLEQVFQQHHIDSADTRDRPMIVSAAVR